MDIIKLDKKDRLIIYELDKNSRQSYSQIGRSVKLSKEVVNYRIQRLEENKIVLGYYLIINHFKLGLNYIRVFFKYQDINTEKEKEIIKYISDLPQIGWLGSQDGIWDLVAVFQVRTNEELNDILKRIYFKFGNYLQDREITPSLRISHFKHHFLHGVRDYSYDLIEGPLQDMKIDEINYRILKSLSEDARKSIIEISNSVGISSKNVIHRIKKLEENGIIIAYKTAFNLPLLGYHYFHIFLNLKDSSYEFEKKVYNYLAQHKYIFYISQALGKADFEFEIALKSHNELFDFMKELRDKFYENIKEYSSVLIYKTYKINYLP
ncbi:MAG: Lrp/AsnC family transcriptional regulator [Nanoarchaeota archaeon]|nr:Lrp/AsnC family transcriptional regulator [Nanoarchaeota archaeon]